AQKESSRHGSDSKSRCKSYNNRDDLTVVDTFVASDTTVEKTMDNIEEMLKPIIHDKKNTVVNNANKVLSPDRHISNRGIFSNESVSLPTIRQNSLLGKTIVNNNNDKERRQLTRTTRIRSSSAPALHQLTPDIRSTPLREKVRDGNDITITQTDIQEKLREGSKAVCNLMGPIRVETSRITSRQSNADITLKDRIELIGCGGCSKNAKLVEFIPTIHRYSSKKAKRMQPSSSQSVKVGENYILIERLSTLKQMPLLYNETKQFEEIRTFRTRESSQGKQSRRRRVKSESAVAKKRIFNVRGPIQVTSKQQIIAGKNGEYTVWEMIELRANGSANEPQEELSPFQNGPAHSSRDAKNIAPYKYDEHIRIGENVIAIERFIKVFPRRMATAGPFSFSEKRSYSTDNTTSIISSASTTSEQPRPSARQSSVGCKTAESPVIPTARSPTFDTAISKRSFCKLSEESGSRILDRSVSRSKSPLNCNMTRTARSPSGCSPLRRLSPRVDPLTPERSPPVPRKRSRRSLRCVPGDEETACSPGPNTSRDMAVVKRNLKSALLQQLSDIQKQRDISRNSFTPSQLSTSQKVAIPSAELPSEGYSAKYAQTDLKDVDDRSPNEARIVRASGKTRKETLSTKAEKKSTGESSSLHSWAQHAKQKPQPTIVASAKKRTLNGRNEESCRTPRSLSAEIPQTSRATSKDASRFFSAESALARLKTPLERIKVTAQQRTEGRISLESPIQVAHKKTVSDELLLKTARKKSEIIERPGSDGKVPPMRSALEVSRKKAIDEEGHGENGLRSLKSGRGESKIFGRCGPGSSKLLKSPLLTPSKNVVVEKGFLKTARERRDVSDSRSGPLGGPKMDGPMHMSRGAMGNDGKVRERSAISQKHESSWTPKQTGRKGMSKEDFLKTAIEISETKMMRSGGEKREAKLLKTGREQSETKFLRTATERSEPDLLPSDRETAELLETSKMIKQESKVRYVPIQAHKENLSTAREIREKNRGEPWVGSLAMHRGDQESYRHFVTASSGQRRENKKWRKKADHVDTARSLSFRSPPRRRNFSTTDENVESTIHVPAASHFRITKDGIPNGQTNDHNVRTARAISMRSRGRMSPSQGTWPMHAARVKRSTWSSAASSNVKRVRDVDTRTSSERTRSASLEGAIDKGATIRSEQAKSRFRKSIRSCDIRTPRSPGATSITSTARSGNHLKTPPSCLTAAQPQRSLSTRNVLSTDGSTDDALNNSNTIVIESVGVHNVVMVLKISFRLKTNGTQSNEKAHGLRTSRVAIGGHVVYGSNSHK
ncbi:hypothetical protein Tcan_18253, partial [Toxocara canis]